MYVERETAREKEREGGRRENKVVFQEVIYSMNQIIILTDISGSFHSNNFQNILVGCGLNSGFQKNNVKF